jgi:uncharacterized protein
MKRILSLDGGGIRGVFALQVLAEIERVFRRESARDDLVLAEVFDLIAGTSTGAIIAACLSWGMNVADIEALYLKCGPEIFAKEHWYRRWKSKYRADPIADEFRSKFVEENGDAALLGSRRLRTLLLVVMRNASTGSPWPVSNNPAAKYNDAALPECNLKVPLWQLLRASTAAPVFFPPEEICVGAESFLFVDGGMSPFNNPTLMAVLMATLPAYRLCWPTGRDQLHVVSVGTGAPVRARLPDKPGERVNLVDALRYLAPAWMGAVSAQQDFICRVLGDCVHGAQIDSEVQKLDAPSLLPAAEQKFTYVRYDQPFDPVAKPEPDTPDLSASLDDLTLVPWLQKAGRKYANGNVRIEHFSARAAST